MMPLLVTVWWLGFWTAVGLCLGSFLNVVIYRLPRNRSLRAPLWSACPYCEHPIRWHDNLPILSFLALRGQCRDCRAPIPTRYLVVEATMALIVLMLIDALMIGEVRVGLSASRFGLTDHLAYDWPILAAHIVLLACLFSMSAIDLEHYWVDVRFTNLATVVGFALHILWTPKHSMAWSRPFDTTAAVSLLALVGLGLVWIVLVCQPHMDPEDFGEPEKGEEQFAAPDRSESELPMPPLEPASRIPGWIALFMLVVSFVWLVAAEVGTESSGDALRALVPLAFFFYLIVRESSIVRESDHEIVEAIEEERFGARSMVLGEFGLLLPALLLGCAGFYLMRAGGDLPEQVHAALHERTHVWGVAMMRSWSPLYGLATAASGYVIAGGLGWAVRIVFTLIFGKEAFGSGDIHLMAAAGCIAGWPVVLLAFVLTCVLAVAGWLISLPFKRTRAVPLGPWLSLAILVVVIFYDAIVEWPIIAPTIDAARMLFLGDSQVWGA
ncbi:MAG: A24 family peptidase [Planctomycetota bacterium]|jgi:prepilin signal peptidase PulO-like enzyme (type II secretory pathway)